MKITYRWMKEFLSFDISPGEMIDRLIMIGHEVEEVIDLGLLDNPIRIARILKVVYDAEGEEKSREDFVDVEATVGEDLPPIPWTGKLMPAETVLRGGQP